MNFCRRRLVPGQGIRSSHAALRTGNEVIVWALKTPTVSELENLAEELGADASRTQVLVGPENLFKYIQTLLK